jgi:hypothetical protein
MSKNDHEAASRGYRPPPAETGRGRKLRVEIPVVRTRRESSPSLPIYSGQSSETAYGRPEEQPRSHLRSAERSPFRTGFGLGLGFATGTALFRLVAVLLFYGLALAVVLSLLRQVF